MVVDFDDFCEINHRLDLIQELKNENAAFKCTVFAIPGLCPENFLGMVPDYIEVAMHGWMHPHPREAENWTYDEAIDVLLTRPNRMVAGWKSPG